jgi:hypothetical protein
MAREYKVTLTVGDAGETVLASGEFTDDESQLLEAFIEYAKDLLNTRLVQSGMPGSLKIHGDQKTGITVTTELPPWDDVIVFLHKFRPLGLQSEKTHFYRICNLLSKALSHPYFRSIIKEQRRVYSGKRMQSAFQIRSNDVLLNSEKVLFDWLNAYEYHREKEKREFIEGLHEMLPLEASKVIFLSLLTDKAEAIFNLATLVRVVLGKQKSAKGRLVKRPQKDLMESDDRETNNGRN